MSLTSDQQAALERWLYDERDLAGLSDDLTRLGLQQYVQRLSELGQRINLRPGNIDAAIAEKLARQAGQSAASIVETHNRDLRAFVEKLDPNVDAAAAVREWEANRADWKSKQVAYNEAMTARNAADGDFRSENDLQVRMRVVPEDAVCAVCQEYVAMGFVSADEADGIDIPAHINCQHGWAYAEGLADALDTLQEVWLGSRIAKEAA